MREGVLGGRDHLGTILQAAYHNLAGLFSATLEDTVVTHLLSGREDGQLLAGPRARQSSAAGADYGARDPEVLETSVWRL